MRIPTILAAFCLMLVSCQQEEGCTDTSAINFDFSAEVDDGSCEYVFPAFIDGYLYEVVTIGDQAWFAENLKTTVYANGDPIPFSLTDDEWVSTNEGATAVYGEGSECEHSSPDIDACEEAQSSLHYLHRLNPQRWIGIIQVFAPVWLPC